MMMENTNTEKSLALFACDPLIDLSSLDMDGELLSPDRTRLLVLMVCEVPEESLSLFRKQLMPPAQLRRQVAAREVELQQHMYEVSKHLEHMGYELDTRIERGKQTGQVIVAVAEQVNAALIVLHRRKQAAWQRLLLGSVGDYVERHATRPLLVLPPRSPS